MREMVGGKQRGVGEGGISDIEEGGKASWVAQLVKRPALDLGSSHDLTVCGFNPELGSVLIVWSLLGILSLSPSLSLLSSDLSLSLSK